MFLDPVMVQTLAGTRGHNIETVFRFPLDGIFRMDAAAFCQRMRQRHTANALWQFIGDQPVEKRLGTGAGKTTFGKGCHIQQPGMGGGMADLIADMLEPVGPAERPVIFLRGTFRRKPVGAFPAKFLAKDSAQILQPVIAGGGPQRPAGPALFIRIVNDKDIFIGLFILHLQIGFGGVTAIAAGINAQHIDGRLALDNPFGKLPAGTASGCHTKAVTLAQPEIRDIPCRADDRVAVRCIGNGAIIYFFHANLAKGRDAMHGGFDMRHQTFQIFLEQLIF